MKPGNLHLQGAKSGGGNRKMREAAKYVRAVIETACFCFSQDRERKN